MQFRKEFRQIVDGSAVLRKIVPPMQQAAKILIDLGGSDERINRIIIFGSATSWRFKPSSDIDICIDGLLDKIEMYHRVEDAFDKFYFPFDLIIWDKAPELLKSEICKGVVIYERSVYRGD